MGGDSVPQPDSPPPRSPMMGWAISPLNEGLTCHDGEALTAEDAAYSSTARRIL
jgi:peptide/nickel transport system substrate-binding protein